jgi:hypothetical protein
LSRQELEGKYMAALSRVSGEPMTASAKRQTPIFRREPEVNEKQSIEDAANALAVLWKIGKR